LAILLFLSVTRRPPSATLFPYTTLFRSLPRRKRNRRGAHGARPALAAVARSPGARSQPHPCDPPRQTAIVEPSRLVTGRRLGERDRKSTRLNSSHVAISYAGFCVKKKNK